MEIFTALAKQADRQERPGHHLAPEIKEMTAGRSLSTERDPE